MGPKREANVKCSSGVIFCSLKKITLCSKSKLLIILKFFNEVSFRSTQLISAPKAPESNFISINLL